MTRIQPTFGMSPRTEASCSSSRRNLPERRSGVTFYYNIEQNIQGVVKDLSVNRSLGTFEVENVANLSDDEVAVARSKNRDLEVN